MLHNNFFYNIIYKFYFININFSHRFYKFKYIKTNI